MQEFRLTSFRVLIVQNQIRPATIRNAIVDLMAKGVVELKVAAAYTTSSGLELLLRAVEESVSSVVFESMPKCLITSFDYGITEPRALDDWMSLDRASVRVSGASNITTGTTIPARAFHPKVYAFRVDNRFYNVLVTSANLTGRGLTSNVEAGWVRRSVPSTDLDEAFVQLSADTRPLTRDLLEAYGKLRSSQPPPRNGLNDGQPVVRFMQANGQPPLFREAVERGDVDLSVFDEMWVQVSALQGGSNNQLELPRQGHRFFGLAFGQYDTEHATIGYPMLRIGSRVWSDRPITWHGNNRMERFNLPTQAQGGPDYSNSVVSFRRLYDESYELVVASPDSDLAHAWAHASEQSGNLFRVGRSSTARLVGLH